MLNSFIMNGQIWKVRFTCPDNPILIERTGNWTVAVTDPQTMTIYLADNIHGEFLTRVTLHELSHAVMYSYGYLDDIHKMCKKRYWIEMEEFIANIIADRAHEIFERAYEIVGDEAIRFVPIELGRWIA